MSISIYNTMSRAKEPLEPLEPGHVKLYVCGITPMTIATWVMPARPWFSTWWRAICVTVATR